MLYKEGLRLRLICLILAVLFFTFSACSNTNQRENNIISTTPVCVQSVARGDINNITLYAGVVRPKKVAYVSSAISGKVSSDFFEVGDSVKKGDLLFTVESTEIEDSIALLEEQLKVAQANISIAEAGVAAVMGSSFKSQKLQLEAALKNAEYNYTAAKKLFDSSALLYEINEINMFEYNKIKNQYEQAKTALETASESYDLYINEISKDAAESANGQLNQAQANYDSIKLQLESTKRKLEYTRITSPMDGIIATKDIASGSLISNTMVPYIIMDTDTVQVSLSLTEQVINKVKKGDEFQVSIPTASTEPFNGVVKTVSPAPDATTFTYSILIDIYNKNNLIKPGMTAKTGLLTEQRKNTILVPLDSVLSENEGKYVFTVEDNKAIKRHVNIGITNDGMVEIISGVDEGELIVVKGQHLLKDNYSVIIVGEASE